MHEKRIEELTAAYENLTSARATVIAVYDRSPDGSREKHQAVRGLDRLGEEIRKVEDELDLLTNPLYDEP